MFSRRTSTVVTVIVVALVTIGLVASALPVFASQAAALPMHAQLVKSSPADGATLTTTPTVTLTFSEEVNEQFLQVRVRGPVRAEADGEPVVDGRTVTQALVPDLVAGKHVVSYRVVSVDGHPISGTVTFTTTEAAVPGADPTTPAPSASTSASPSASASASVSPSASASATSSPTATATSDADPASADEGSVPWVAIVVGLLLGVLLGTVLVRLVLARARRGAGPPPAGD
ncbi:copper resistance CopC family protein [Phycicoccus avicenniae]|uniref:copper resistance CopC family protein n=1 Tax=Phycicoccus avicenniae TaxID=2828860 RepID=UPI003D2B5BE9